MFVCQILVQRNISSKNFVKGTAMILYLASFCFSKIISVLAIPKTCVTRHFKTEVSKFPFRKVWVPSWHLVVPKELLKDISLWVLFQRKTEFLLLLSKIQNENVWPMSWTLTPMKLRLITGIHYWPPPIRIVKNNHKGVSLVHASDNFIFDYKNFISKICF